MHRTIDITVAADRTDALLAELIDLEHVIGLSVARGASLKPPGDVVTVHALNRGTDDVLKVAAAAGRRGPLSVVTAEVASIIDPALAPRIDNDVDEGIWEEMETGLRHQGRVTSNFLVLMALGGAIAAAALVSEPVPQAIASVAASIIAPGFEPLAKIPLGLVLGRPNVVRRGLVSTTVGYGVLIAAAALMFWALRGLDQTTTTEFAANPEVERLTHLTWLDTLVSTCAALAGVTMVAAFRRTVIAGPLVALVLVPAAAAVGAALAAGEPDLAGGALLRLGADALLIVLLGAIFFTIKQRTTHQRRSMV